MQINATTVLITILRFSYEQSLVPVGFRCGRRCRLNAGRGARGTSRAWCLGRPRDEHSLRKFGHPAEFCVSLNKRFLVVVARVLFNVVGGRNVALAVQDEGEFLVEVRVEEEYGSEGELAAVMQVHGVVGHQEDVGPVLRVVADVHVVFVCSGEDPWLITWVARGR